MNFVPYESSDIVLFCKALDHFVSMLPNPFDEIVRHPGVERAVPLTGKYVHIERHTSAKGLGPRFRRGRTEKGHFWGFVSDLYHSSICAPFQCKMPSCLFTYS